MYSWSFPKELDRGNLEPSNPGTMPRYEIKTKKSLLSDKRKQTELVPFGHALGGVILWKDKSISVGGTTRKIEDIRNRPSKMSRTKEWHWSNLHTPYVVAYSSSERRWTATIKGHSQPCTVFTKRKSHLLRDSEPARITFHANLPVEEVTFLLLVMIYSEIAREDRLDEDADLVEKVLDVAAELV